jgi:hypothetical protein
MKCLSLFFHAIFLLLAIDANFLRAEEHNESHARKMTQVPKSPTSFRRLAAYIRFNENDHLLSDTRALLDRLTALSRYQNHFGVVTFSLPRHGSPQSLFFHRCDDTNLSYACLAAYMDMLSPSIDGVVYFHFDFWLYPHVFSQYLDPSFAWYLETKPLGPNTDIGFKNAATCFDMTNPPPDMNWWGMSPQIYKKMPHIMRELHSKINHTIDPHKVCAGWADLYYVPRSQFSNFRALSSIFAEHDGHHEVAVPTMMDILDTLGNPVLQIQCWGSCCSKDPTPKDVQTHACGHRLDWTSVSQVNAFDETFYRQEAFGLHGQDASMIEKMKVT